MRDKTELKQRDGYANLFAAMRITRMIVQRLTSSHSSITIRIEDETIQDGDDVTEIETVSGEPIKRCFQVKRQYSTLDSIHLSRLLQTLTDPSITEATIALPAPVNVSGVADIRFLKTLIERASQAGADCAQIATSARDNELKWIAFAAKEFALDHSGAVARLAKLRVLFAGDDATLREAIRERLELHYERPVTPIIDALQAYASTVDGTTEITFDIINDNILKHHKRLQPAAHTDFYASLLATVEDRLWLSKWRALSDTLIRDMMPSEFSADIDELAILFRSLVWPEKETELEAAFRNVVDRAVAYATCFHQNSDMASPRLFRENLAYKRRWDPIAYDIGLAGSKRWSDECFARLQNLVVSLNELAAATRATISPQYRLSDGRFFIEDSLGYRHGSTPCTIHPEHYHEAGEWKST